MPRKFQVCLLLLIGSLLSAKQSSGQQDTIDLLPFARVTVPKGEWIKKNDDRFQELNYYFKILKKSNPNIGVKLRISKYKEKTLMDHVHQK